MMETHIFLVTSKDLPFNPLLNNAVGRLEQLRI